MVDVGKMIAAIRKDRKMSQSRLAQKINTTKQTISNYERGERRPDYVTLEAIADVLNVPVSMLISREEQKKALEGIYGTSSEPGSVNSIIHEENDSDVFVLREELRRDPNRRMLFDLAKNGSKRDIDQAVALIDALKKTNPDFYDGDDPS